LKLYGRMATSGMPSPLRSAVTIDAAAPVDEKTFPAGPKDASPQPVHCAYRGAAASVARKASAAVKPSGRWLEDFVRKTVEMPERRRGSRWEDDGPNFIFDSFF